MPHRLRDPQFLAGRWTLQGHAQDVSGHGNDGTWAGTEAYSIFNRNGLSCADFNGTNGTIDCGDVGTVRSLAFWVRPDTTTEEFLLIDAGKTIELNAGTIAYAGVAATATYVDGAISTTLVALHWQHVVCVLTADHAGTNFELATDGVNFGACEMFDVRAYSVALTNDEALKIAHRSLAA